MRIRRDYYLNRLIGSRHNGLIKIITGIRRSGKSFLLFELFDEYLRQNGIDDEHIIKVALDDRRYASLRDPDAMIAYVDGKIVDSQRYYILLDEVQMMREFVDVLNSLLHIKNADVYVTGSNSKFLSSDVATEFRGRGDELHLFPLSFAEYYGAVGGDKAARWREYYTFGGLPQLLVYDDESKKADYLRNLYRSVYLKDIIERHHIKKSSEFEELLQVISSSVGAPCNPNKLSNTFRSVKGINIDNKTVSRYLEYMEGAFFIERSRRYDVKGKRYINSLSKYYFQDIGMRNALLGFRQLEESHIMENIIYNELRLRGYAVDVGTTEIRTANKRNETVRKQLEVDFVANKGYNRYYIQSALTLSSREKKEQETAPFRQIADSFRKIFVVRDDIMPYFDDNGYLIIGLFDFLLSTGMRWE